MLIIIIILIQKLPFQLFDLLLINQIQILIKHASNYLHHLVCLVKKTYISLHSIKLLILRLIMTSRKKKIFNT